MGTLKIARQNMVTNQLMPNKISNERLLDVLAEVPKHQFLEGMWQTVAYTDAKIPISDSRTMLKPEEFALMVQSLKLTGDERVMDIGCGTGYSTHVLAHLCSQVLGIENDPHLATKALNSLTHLKVDNAVIINGELLSGDPKNAPFEAIFVNGCLAEEPKTLLSQLTVYGRLVCVMQLANGLKKAVLFENLGNTFSKTELFDATADLLK